VERLGNMTPEELEAIPGIGPDLVEHIRDVVVSYYGQYDDGSEVPQDDESQQQQPTLEIGQEGYNYSESDNTAEASAASSIDDSTQTADPGREALDEQPTGPALAPEEADQDESAKLGNAE